MNAGWMFLRTELRKRWRSWLALALIVGAFAGAVEAAAAGARRTDAAYPALLTWSRAPDLLAASAVGPSVFGHISQSALAGLPQVAGKALLAEYAVAQPSDVALVAPETGKVPVTFWRRKILAGRLPDPRRADEADISFTLAQARHLRVGDVLQVDALTTGAKPRPVPFTFHIVGIDAAPSEFPPQTGTGTDDLWATPAFYARHDSGLAIFRMAALRLRHGAAEIPPVLHEINRLAHGRPTLTYPLATQSANTERSIHLQAVALWLLAALLAVIGVLVTGQLLARQGFLEGDDFGTLRALGMSPRQLLAAGLARAAVIGAGGAVAAGLLAVAASPLFPVGLARVAEPYPGLRVDGRGGRPGGAGHGARDRGLRRPRGLAVRRREHGTGAPVRGRSGPAAAGRDGGRPRDPSGSRPARHRAGGPARSGQDRRAGTQHDRQRGRRGRRAHRGDRLLGQPRAPARHPAPLRGELGR